MNAPLVKLPWYANSPWTDARVETLKALWEQGLSANMIADELACGLTRNSVIGKLHRLGLGRQDRKNKPAPQPKAHKTRFNRKAPKWLDDAITRARAGRVSFKPTEPEQPVRLIDDQDIPLAQRKSLMELTDQTCRWPVGTPCTPEFFYCGGTSIEGRPYCIHHHLRAYSHAPRQAFIPRKPSIRMVRTGGFDMAAE